jgi:hypothetical protein
MNKYGRGTHSKHATHAEPSHLSETLQGLGGEPFREDVQRSREQGFRRFANLRMYPNRTCRVG